MKSWAKVLISVSLGVFMTIYQTFMVVGLALGKSNRFDSFFYWVFAFPLALSIELLFWFYEAFSQFYYHFDLFPYFFAAIFNSSIVYLLLNFAIEYLKKNSN